ncbi:endonuclease/exonuclease/phosphatase family metal-dependent hydrolase [Methanomicrobium sp. W14]|uniref:endonuclease/exonuclease/phosphatase family protein n=1 Tax=Methanomicrobium sp. W14 TaxID=2817839 RepID=UPI001AE91DE3|nr:lamin tail domain-containing protein [Methanomicrobium sp. W14]MBP2132482.1 endonuclease/exonuclease/phosphatase family metal-dependent hydrolase [Methanomicrobium sp. W14]
MAARKKKSHIFLKFAVVAVIFVVAFSQRSVIINSVDDVVKDISPGDSKLLKVGAFNIQVFGTSKADKDDVMNVLAKIIRDYDIIAIEEIRDISNTSLPKLVNLVNSDGSEYSYFVSERLGRTSSKEQYAYIYNTKTVEPLVPPFVYPYDTQDIFHRDPYIGSFKSTEGVFNATFVVIHTDPDDAREEIDGLYNVAEYAKGVLSADETVVVMGDFNADGSYFDEDSYTPMKSGGYNWVTDNSEDTTTGNTNCTYDRIVLTGSGDFYTGTAGVFRFDQSYSLSEDLTKQVSDHYPVYAMFSKGLTRNDSGIFGIDIPYITGNDSSEPSQDGHQNDNKSGKNYPELSRLSLRENTVVISNTGSGTIDLGNYRITSVSTGNSYVFPEGLNLPPFGMITLYSSTDENQGYTLYWNAEEDVWNDTKDSAELYSPSGVLIDTITSTS